MHDFLDRGIILWNEYSILEAVFFTSIQSGSLAVLMLKDNGACSNDVFMGRYFLDHIVRD